MLRELLKREPGWKYAPYVALAAAAIWPFFLLHGARTNIFLFLVFSLTQGAARRASPFEAALPIPGRQLVAARLIARLTMLWLVLLVMTAEALILHRRELADATVMFAAVLTFGFHVEQSLRMREATPPRYGFLLCFPACFLLGAPFHLSGPALTALLLAASAALVVRLWRHAPEGFQLAPAQPARVGRLNPRRWFSWRLRASPWWPAWRSIHFFWGYVVFAIPAFLFGGVWLGGAFLTIPAAAARSRVEWLALLPVSRRRLLFMMVLPWLSILIAIPFLAARLASAPMLPAVSTGYSETPTDASAGTGTPNVMVPATYWHWAADEGGSVIHSPWGEEVHPGTHFRLGLTFYNPYSVAPNNSARFLEWQFARATEAVYGRSVPLAQSAQLRTPGWIPIARQVRTQCIAALAASLVFLGMLLLTFWFKAGGGGCLTSFVWFLLLLPFVGDFCTATTVRESGPLSEILNVRFARVLPQSWGALLLLALLLLAGAYLALERQFQRVELAASLRRLDRAAHR